MVLVGRIARPHGLRGDVVVNPETDFVADRFASGATLWTRSWRGDDVLTVLRSRVQGRRPIVGFEGFECVEDAQRLVGQELRVPEADLVPLEPGTYYEHDLTGCRVETEAGQRVGTVTRVEGGAGNNRLVVDSPRGEVQIPLAREICREIDVAGKRITIVPPDGLLELNQE